MKFRLPKKLSMAATLALAFGGMMALALGIVIFGSFMTAGKNTQDLMSERTNLILDYLTEEVRDFLGPAERALQTTAELFAAHGDDMDTIDGVVRGIQRSLPQIIGIGIITNGTHLRIIGDVPKGMVREQIFPESIFEHAAGEPENDGVYWVDPVYSPEIDETFLNARLHLPDVDGMSRTLVTGVRIDVIAGLLNQLAEKIGQQVFILHGRDHVVAHTGFHADDYDLGIHQPLPRLDQIDDKYLRHIWQDGRHKIKIFDGQIDGEAWVVPAHDYAYGYIYRDIPDFATLPWIVGLYLNLRDNDDEITRLFRSAGIALAISIVAILLTLKLGKKLSLPVERLAARAEAIRGLDATALEPLPESRIRELNEASMAFNAMGSALHWFETYLPKRLVAQLMQHGSPDNVLSEEREVTIMFTDIVAFSSRANMLTPAQTAAFLNGHFDQLSACVAAEDGVIDKYIGDSMMAFWGAPQIQPDHAERAIAAALRIREALAGGDVGLRIGIHTGKALVGNIGANDRLNYTVVGDAVNIAQRIEQHGRAVMSDNNVTILISRATIAQCAVDGQSMGSVTLRGQNAAIELVAL